MQGSEGSHVIEKVTLLNVKVALRLRHPRDPLTPALMNVHGRGGYAMKKTSLPGVRGEWMGRGRGESNDQKNFKNGGRIRRSELNGRPLDTQFPS